MSSSASEHAIEPGARLMKTFSIGVLNIRHRSGGQHHLVPYSLESSRPGTDSQTHTASQDLNLTWEIKSEIKTNKSKFQGCKCFWFLWPGLHQKVWRLSHLKRPCFSAPQDCKSLSTDPYMYIYLLLIPNDKCLAISSGKIFTTFLWSLLLAKGFANNLVIPSLRKKSLSRQPEKPAAAVRSRSAGARLMSVDCKSWGHHLRPCALTVSV